MQFEPGDIGAVRGVDHRPLRAPADPDDPQDAIYTAARYLHASGAPGDWQAAIFAYNHAGWYVHEVQAYALRYSGPTGLQLLAQDIAAVWGGKQPSPPTGSGARRSRRLPPDRRRRPRRPTPVEFGLPGARAGST